MEEEKANKPAASLYGDLLSIGTISKEPVRYDQGANENNSALRFKPVRRKQAGSKGTKGTFNHLPSKVSGTVSNESKEFESFSAVPNIRWKSNKRNKASKQATQIDWNEDYDPTRPNLFGVYIDSEERYLEDDDWRSYLENLTSGTNKNETQSQSETREHSEMQGQSESSLDQHPFGVEPTTETPETQEQTNSFHEIETDSTPSRGKAFASRLLKKYGWKPGMALGSSNQGITKALKVSIDRQRKGMGKIIDVNRKKMVEDSSSKLSKVIVIRNMVSLQQMEDESLAGQIGTACESYGDVERVMILPKDDGGDIFIKFVSESSALGALNGLEGNDFEGRTLRPSFYDEHQFEEGIYDVGSNAKI